MRVLIVGAGIGGLALAAFLRERGIRPVVVEQAPRWETIGFVLAIWPNGVSMLKRLGVFNSIRARSAKLDGVAIRDDSGALLSVIDFRMLRDKYGQVIEVERDALHQALSRISGDVRMNTTIRSVRQTKSAVVVRFSNGREALFDVVVGADGVDSMVRRFVMPKAHKDYTGITFWMFWTPLTFPLPKKVQYYVGNRRFFALFPAKSKRHVCVLFAVPAKEHSLLLSRQSVSFLKQAFGGMGGVVPQVLAGLPRRPASIFHRDDDEMHFTKWCKGRVVLIGDAAHALSPMVGMGASMAMEDAYVLAEELAHGDIDAALQRYAERRHSRIAFLMRASRMLHWLVKLGSPFSYVRNAVLKLFCSRRMYAGMMDRFLGEEP